LCILGSITTVARELARYKLDIMRVQEVRWVKGGTVRAEELYFVLGMLAIIRCRIFCLPVSYPKI
jgi:hypothetical protein